MADNFVQPLSGEEIITDVCAQLADRLRKDCTLRDADAYAGGYKATIKIHLEAYDMDTATVDAEVVTTMKGPNPPDRLDEIVDTEIEIPLEPALDLVRERSDQPVPTLTQLENGEQEIKPRRYVRRARVVGENNAA